MIAISITDRCDELLCAYDAGYAQGRADAMNDKDAALARIAMLSPRQQEVVKLLTKGLSNKDIGCAMGVSPRTAEQHTYCALKALGVSNRLQAAIIGLQAGLGYEL